VDGSATLRTGTWSDEGRKKGTALGDPTGRPGVGTSFGAASIRGKGFSLRNDEPEKVAVEQI
jgi:hypothetical protein